MEEEGRRGQREGGSRANSTHANSDLGLQSCVSTSSNFEFGCCFVRVWQILGGVQFNVAQGCGPGQWPPVAGGPNGEGPQSSGFVFPPKFRSILASLRVFSLIFLVVFLIRRGPQRHTLGVLWVILCESGRPRRSPGFHKRAQRAHTWVWRSHGFQTERNCGWFRKGGPGKGGPGDPTQKSTP